MTLISHDEPFKEKTFFEHTKHSLPRYRLKKFFLFYPTTIGEETDSETWRYIAQLGFTFTYETIATLREASVVEKIKTKPKPKAFTLAEVLIAIISDVKQTFYTSNALLADGSIISFFLDGGNCQGKVGTTPALNTMCGQIFWDVNGAKAPNKEGHDVFGFYLTNLGIVPQGSQAETHIYSFSKGCLVPFTNGARRGCTAWVIYSGNMDYLHCSDLSWDGNKKCDR